VQFPPAAPAGREKGAVITTVIPVSVPAPVLCRMRVRAALVEPVPTFPNASGPPVTLQSRCWELPATQRSDVEPGS